MDWDSLQVELDEIATKPEHDERLADYRRLLADLSPGDEGRAEILSCLADELRTDGALDEARTTYQDAIDDGGRTILDPRAGLLAVALTSGDDATADELLATLLTRSRAGDLVVGDHEWIADSLEAAGRLRAALRWFTIPLRDIDPGDVDRMPIMCLDGRWRVRRALDLPVDAYDDAHDMWHQVNDSQR
jgi:tetratricopeptide (TPR) repeat protein